MFDESVVVMSFDWAEATRILFHKTTSLNVGREAEIYNLIETSHDAPAEYPHIVTDKSFFGDKSSAHAILAQKLGIRMKLRIRAWLMVPLSLKPGYHKSSSAHSRL